MFCVNCGTKLRERALFCTNCGTKVDEELLEQASQMLADNTPVIPQEVAPAVAAVEVDVAPVELDVTPAEADVTHVVDDVAGNDDDMAQMEAMLAAIEPDAAPVQTDVISIEEALHPVQPEIAPVIQETKPAEVRVTPVETKTAPVTFDFPTTGPNVVPVAPVVSAAPVAAPVKQPKTQKQKQPKRAKSRRKPHIAVRTLLQLLSFVLCITLVACVLATVVVADINHLLSAGGMKQVINGILIPTAAPQRVTPGIRAVSLSMDSVGNVTSNDIPKDMLSGETPEENTENLVKWIYQKIEEANGNPLKFDENQLMEFIQESTAADFLAQKLADYAQDFVNGTEEASISVDEIMDLLDENEELLEDTFNVQLTAKQRRNIESNVQKVIEQNDLDHMLREQVFASVEKAIETSMKGTDMSWEDVQRIMKLVCSDTMLYISVGICVLLILLLCLLNFYNVPAGLTWSAVPAILIGLVLNAPLWLVAIDSDMLSELLPTGVVTALSSLVAAILPIHSIVLYVGLGLLVISIVWRAIRSTTNRERSAYEV